ncbi:hypothetical protein [Mycobacterium sp.]|uniref:hypothetical protein n=1 Tax=Mycobacterium sp. TaxID=1785 RepID=UPI002B6789EC|nr:hypothetical protein [Mycobacterium sp.]HTY30472.1 hypothetical protein [Mycobacterium sp.]
MTPDTETGTEKSGTRGHLEADLETIGHGNPAAEQLKCHVCHHDYERPDMLACDTHGAHVCSLCLSTDRVGDHVLPAHG